jgi:hypothetical protein
MPSWRHRVTNLGLRSFLVAALFLFVVAAASPPRTPALPAINCDRDSTGLIPLNDLGPSLYLGAQGGLYPSGSNQRPAGHTASGLSIANSIEPLDTLGFPDPNGRVVLISIGMSNTTQEFQTFIPKANADPARNPRLLIVDCAVGGQPANVIRNPNAAYWDSVSARLRRAGSSPAQVQVAWLKQANARPTGGFPASAETLRGNLAAIARILKRNLPNLSLTYVTSRIYAGYATTNLNPEPYAYESGFAVKWLIESQIAGVDSLNFDPALGPVQASWLSWGPYLWADGMEPRSDVLVWPCSYFASDGTHPAAGARNLVADNLLAFFKRDETTAPWFTLSPTAVPVQAHLGRTVGITRVYPVPAAGSLTVEALVPWGAQASIRLYTASGRLIRAGRLERLPSGAHALSVDVSRLPSGIYYVQYRDERNARDRSSRKVVIVR